MDAVIHQKLRDEKREIGRKLLNIAEQAVFTEDGDSKLKLKTLCIFVDKDNLLRVKTRIAQRVDKIFDIQWFCTRTMGGDCKKVG
jgi:hypothetical protein